MKRHIAGIIPVSGKSLDFNMPWHDSLMPLAPDYLLVQRSVAECAYAGCSTIWIVCRDDIQPLIRYQVGEKVQDPVYVYRHFEKAKDGFQKPIRIYYVPLSVRDLNKRDCLAYGAIYGALSARKIMGALSGHLAPDLYYVSWPYGYYNPEHVRVHRKTIAEGEVLLSYNSQTVKDNLYLGLCMSNQQVDFLQADIKKKSTGLWLDPELRDKRLPLHERYSYRNFNLSEVFDTLDGTTSRVDIDEYCNLDNWSSYCEFIENNKSVEKPAILNYAEWNEVGFD